MSEKKMELLRIKQKIRNASLEDFDNAMEECGYKEDYKVTANDFVVQNYVKAIFKERKN